MTNKNASEQKKNTHIQINLKEDVNSTLGTGFEKYRLLHNALPEIAFSDVDPSQALFGRKINYPVLISSMTGGTSEAAKINQILAAIAQEFGLSMGVGSQRVAIEKPETLFSFKVRETAPDILLFANLGAVQLNYAFTVEHCRRAIDTIGADALILHLNPLQEALMDKGDTDFSGLLKKIEEVCKLLEKPVVVKEVGWGISVFAAKRLVEVGVQAIDIAGAGGTSWSEVEKHRSENLLQKRVAEAFRNWGIPTANALVEIHAAFPDLPVFASGGIKDGVEITKSVALGARLGGIARPFLKTAALSHEDARLTAKMITKQIRITMFSVGAKKLTELDTEKIQKCYQ